MLKQNRWKHTCRQTWRGRWATNGEGVGPTKEREMDSSGVGGGGQEEGASAQVMTSSLLLELQPSTVKMTRG